MFTLTVPSASPQTLSETHSNQVFTLTTLPKMFLSRSPLDQSPYQMQFPILTPHITWPISSIWCRWHPPHFIYVIDLVSKTLHFPPTTSLTLPLCLLSWFLLFFFAFNVQYIKLRPWMLLQLPLLLCKASSLKAWNYHLCVGNNSHNVSPPRTLSQTPDSTSLL